MGYPGFNGTAGRPGCRVHGPQNLRLGLRRRFRVFCSRITEGIRRPDRGVGGQQCGAKQPRKQCHFGGSGSQSHLSRRPDEHWFRRKHPSQHRQPEDGEQQYGGKFRDKSQAKKQEKQDHAGGLQPAADPPQKIDRTEQEQRYSHVCRHQSAMGYEIGVKTKQRQGQYSPPQSEPFPRPQKHQQSQAQPQQQNWHPAPKNQVVGRVVKTLRIRQRHGPRWVCLRRRKRAGPDAV